jgi:hypothetical protein
MIIRTRESEEDDGEDGVDSVPGQPGVCCVDKCVELRTKNTKGKFYIRHCIKHAEEHRERCRKSYRRKVSRNNAIGQQKTTIEDMKTSLVDERIANRRLRKRLETIQKDHDAFVATVTATASPGTPKGDGVILAILQKLHETVSELVATTERDEGLKLQMKSMRESYDKLLEKHTDAVQKLGQLQGKLLSQKQLTMLIKES